MRASGAPSTRIAPDVGSYIRARSLTSVVFPAPFSPTIATTAPAGRVSETLSTARRDVPGYANDTPSSRMPSRSRSGAAQSVVALNAVA